MCDAKNEFIVMFNCFNSQVFSSLIEKLNEQIGERTCNKQQVNLYGHVSTNTKTKPINIIDSEICSGTIAFDYFPHKPASLSNEIANSEISKLNSVFTFDEPIGSESSKPK